jgi:outer membrane protein assembly factor BamA
LKQKITPYIYVLFLVVFSNNFFAQKFNLRLLSEKANNNAVLEKIKFQHTHADSIAVLNEIDEISSFLKNIGYFTNTINKITKIDTTYIAEFSLGDKIEKVIIRNPPKEFMELLELTKENDTISIPITQLQFLLNTISKKLDKEGKSFSKVQLSDIEIKEKVIFADLKIHESTERTINKVLIKGYELFPKAHIKHYFNIKENTVFNREKIEEISTSTRSLQFAKETKEPEVLFTKDSTLLYIYLKKKQNNSFDGLVNFTSKEKGGILFNGHLDLKLNNILNSGERFELFWNSIGEEKQEFKVATEIPYVFNTPVSPSITFTLFKQDSTFLNTELKTNLSYNINSKTKIAATYSSINSKNLQENTTTNSVEEFKNSFWGFIFSYSKPRNDHFNNDKILLKVHPTIGHRNSKVSTSKQVKIELTTSYIWELNERSSIFIKNKTGYLTSDDFLDNELYRIGGANSIRGYNEQSIYTNRFSVFNIEYRFLTSQTSYLYSITDIASVNSGANNETLLGIGVGYLFKTNNSQINISTAVGKNTSNKFDFNTSKIIIRWKNYF